MVMSTYSLRLSHEKAAKKATDVYRSQTIETPPTNSTSRWSYFRAWMTARPTPSGVLTCVLFYLVRNGFYVALYSVAFAVLLSILAVILPAAILYSPIVVLPCAIIYHAAVHTKALEMEEGTVGIAYFCVVFSVLVALCGYVVGVAHPDNPLRPSDGLDLVVSVVEKGVAYLQ